MADRFKALKSSNNIQYRNIQSEKPNSSNQISSNQISSNQINKGNIFKQRSYNSQPKYQRQPRKFFGNKLF